MHDKHRILVVDDDDHLREVIRYALAREGLDVHDARDGEIAWAQLLADAPDLLVLDVNMPRLDGFALCRRVRARGATPILLLSSRTDEVDRVLGFDLGADDYVTKPFSIRELVGRVKAILRRGGADPVASDRDDILSWGRLRLAPARHRAWIGEHEVRLTATEFRLLAALLHRRDRVLTRAELAGLAYADGRCVCERTLDSHVRRVRAKLRAFGIDPIETVHGIGFRLGAAA